MSTFDQLTDSALLYLYGFTTAQDQATYLTSNIAADAVSLPLADASAVSRGVVEIGDELLWVDSTDTSANTAAVPPYGRGYRGTTAAAHTSGTRVTASPLFPRHLVKDALNQAVQAVFPDLFAVSETTLTYSPAISTYELPSGALDVLAVTWQTVGPSKEWLPVRRWRVDKHAATSVFTSGASVSVYDAITPGRTVKVIYTKQPSVMSSASDVFSTVTGLPASSEDVIRLGAAYRLLPFFDSPHLSGMSAEADFAAGNRQVGSAASLGRYMLQVYQARLVEESRKLRDVWPVRSHYTR